MGIITGPWRVDEGTYDDWLLAALGSSPRRYLGGGGSAYVSNDDSDLGYDLGNLFNSIDTSDVTIQVVANRPVDFSGFPHPFWSATSGIGYPVFNGLAPYEPWDEFNADSTAVGWEFEPIGPGFTAQFRYLDYGRCDTAGLMDEYDAWSADPAGEDAYYDYRDRNPVTISSGYINVRIKSATWTTSDTQPHALPHTLIIGTASPFLVGANDQPNQVTYPEFVYPQYPTSVSGTVVTSPATGQEFQVPLPSVQTVTGYGPCRLPAARFLDVPPSSYPTVPISCNWTSKIQVFLECYGTADRQPWRMLTSTAVSRVAIPLRQNRRTDGLIGAGRQTGRTNLRQSQRVY